MQRSRQRNQRLADAQRREFDVEIAKPLGRGHGDRHDPLTDKTADRTVIVVQRLLGRIVIERRQMLIMRTAVLGVRVVISIVIGHMVAERRGAVTRARTVAIAAMVVEQTAERADGHVGCQQQASQQTILAGLDHARGNRREKDLSRHSTAPAGGESTRQSPSKDGKIVLLNHSDRSGTAMPGWLDTS